MSEFTSPTPKEIKSKVASDSVKSSASSQIFSSTPPAPNLGEGTEAATVMEV